MRRLLAVLALAVVAVVAAPTAASAHPLGNFTVNTADQVVVTADGVDVLHVVDSAEIPTVQLRPTLDADGSGRLSSDELASYARGACAEAQSLVALRLDGRPAQLRLVRASAAERPGQAGLTTLRLECLLRADGARPTRLALSDAAAADRNGWKEVTVSTRCGRVASSDVPARSPSAVLTAYPEDELASPLRVTSATAALEPGPCTAGEGSAADAVAAVLPRGVDRATEAFTGLVGRESLGLPLALAALALSVVFGAVHALAPGHGKTVVAAYLVGQRGTRRQAVWLGAAVTLSHTGSVLLLGALLTVGSLAAPGRVVPAAEVLSGLLLVGLGGWLLHGAIRRRRSLARSRHADGHGHHPHPHPHPHEHEHEHPHGHDHAHADEHPHEHGHEHPHGTAHAHPHASPDGAHSHGGVLHSHAPLTEAPLGWRSLAVMGLAGGLVPSPSALVVLLGATALGRAPFGVLLVVGYGLGMAATLTAAGLLLLRAQAAIARRGWRAPRLAALGRALPAVTASVVVLVGAGLVARGVQTGRMLF